MLNKVFSGTVKEINWKNYIKQNVEQSRIDNRFTLASRCCSKRHFPCFGLLCEASTLSCRRNFNQCRGRCRTLSNIYDHKHFCVKKNSSLMFDTPLHSDKWKNCPYRFNENVIFRRPNLYFRYEISYILLPYLFFITFNFLSR